MIQEIILCYHFFEISNTKRAQELGISIIFHILFILLIVLSVFLICVFQEITLSQLPIILKSNLVASGFSADNIINAFKNFISYFFGLDDHKYDS